MTICMMIKRNLIGKKILESIKNLQINSKEIN
jgi:hypothetical protein